LDVGREARRYMFAVELKAGSRTEYVWSPEVAMESYKNVAEPQDYEVLKHFLILKRAIVGASAKENEGNLVSVEVDDPEVKEKVAFPLVYLTKGKDSQAPVDLSFPDVSELGVKFTLTEGAGPVHIIGYHFIDRVPTDPEDAQDDEGEEEEDEESAAHAVEMVKAAIRAKRRMNGNGTENGDAAPKKAKVEKEENGEEDDEDDEEMENENEAAAADVKSE